jgi:hypothetical protein
MKPLPKHQHDFSDEAFLREFDTSIASLRPMYAALADGHLELAKTALVDHFRTRKKPAWIADFRDGRRGYLPTIGVSSLKPNRAETLRLADGLLKNEFELGHELILRFGPNLDWVRPDTCDIGVPGNGFRCCRYFHTLAAAHTFTRKASYAEKFSELAERWVNDWPFAIDADFHKDTLLFGTDRNYKTLPTGNRLLSWLSALYGGILFDKRVSTETAFQLIKALWFTAAHYLIFRRARYQPGNHHVMRCGTIPGVMGIMFPETPRFHPFLDLSRKTIAQHIRKSYLADGGYEERSTSYTNATLGMFLMPLVLAKRNKITLSSSADKTTLRRCAEMMATLYAPMGHPLPVGDGGRNDAETFTALLIRINEISKSSRIASVLHHLNLNRFAGKESHIDYKPSPVPPLAVRYPASGYAVIRSGWSVHDSAAAINIPDGTNTMYGHAHDDALSFNLVIKGVSIIACPSEELYISVNDRKFRGTPYRGFPYSMEAHNLVLVGGKSLQSPESLGDAWSAATPAVTSVLSKEKLVITLRASHTGYADTTVERMLSYSKNGIWTITDRVVGPPRKKHILRWHFDYGVEVRPTENGYEAKKTDVTVQIEIESEGTHKSREYQDAKWMRPNKMRSGKSNPWVIDTSFGGTGNDTIVTRFVEE